MVTWPTDRPQLFRTPDPTDRPRRAQVAHAPEFPTRVASSSQPTPHLPSIARSRRPLLGGPLDVSIPDGSRRTPSSPDSLRERSEAEPTEAVVAKRPFAGELCSRPDVGWFQMAGNHPMLSRTRHEDPILTLQLEEATCNAVRHQ